MLRTFSIPGVRRLTALYATAELVEWLGSIALMLLVYGRTGSALSAGVMLVCKQIVPAVLSPVSGRLIDRFSPARFVIAGFGLQATALLAVGAVGYGPALYALAVGSGLGGTLARASFRATLASSLKGEARRSANGLFNATMGLVSLVGPGAGAALATAASPETALLVAGAAALFAAVLAGATIRARIGDVAVGPEAAAPSPDPETGTSTGAAAAAPLPLPLWLLLTFTATIAVGLAMDEPSLLPYAERSLQAGPGAYGAILTLWGLGIIVGSVAFPRISHVPMLTVAAAGTSLTALGYIGLAVAPSVAVACLVAVVGGIGNGFSWVALVTAVQEATPPDRQGRLATRLEAIITAGPAVGFLLGGAVADAASPRLTLLIPGLIALSVVAAGAALATRRSRRLVTAAQVVARG